MTLLDWGILVVWAGFTLSGFWKGAVRIVFGIGGAAAGVWLAVAFGEQIAAALLDFVAIHWIAALLGRFLPVLACVAFFLAAGWGIGRTLEAMHMGWVNHFLGACLAGLVGAILIGVFLVAAVTASPTWLEICEQSTLAPYMIEVWQILLGVAS